MRPINSHSSSPSGSNVSLLEPLSLRSVLMWAVAALFYFYQFVLRASPSVMTEELQNAFCIEACSLGTLISFYYYGYVGAQVPVGIILDRVGIRGPLTGASLLCFLGSILFVLSKSLLVISLGRFLIGVGSAFGFLSALKLATLWIPNRYFSFFIGLTMLFGTAGGAAGGGPLSYLVDHLGWQQSLLGFAILSSLIAILAFLLVRNHPDPGTGSLEQDASHPPLLRSMKQVLSNPQTWIIGAYGCLMYVPLSGFADLWGVPYVMSAFGVQKAKAAGSVSMFYIGIGLGCPLTALISDRLKRINTLLLWGALFNFLLMAMVLYCKAIPFSMSSVFFLLAGMASSVQFLAFATITNLNPFRISGIATAIHNMICMTSGIGVQPLIGYLLDFLSKRDPHTLVQGVYLENHYRMALSSVLFSVFIAAVLVFFIKEGYERPSEMKTQGEP